MFTKNLINQQSNHHLNLSSPHQNFKGCSGLQKSSSNGLSCAFGDLASLLDAVDILETSKSSSKNASTRGKSNVELNSIADTNTRRNDLSHKTYDFIRESFIIERRGSAESSEISSPTENYNGGSLSSNETPPNLNSDELAITEDIRRVRNGFPMGAKIPRKRIKPEVAKTLQDLFDNGTHFPSREERESLASQLSLTARTIQIWFQNKRQALRNRKMIESPDGFADSIDGEDDNDNSITNGNDILMTKMTFGRKGGSLSTGQNHILKAPGFLNQERAAKHSSDNEGLLVKRKFAVHEKATVPHSRKRCSISELTKESTPRLPLHPSMMAFTPMMQGLPRTLPKLQFEGEIDFLYGSSDLKGRSASLPSIGRALRRSSII